MESNNHQALSLAREVVEAVESGSCGPEQLALKAQRLAVLVGAESHLRNWLRCEVIGYHPDNPDALKYMEYTSRWMDAQKDRGFWGPLAEVEEQIQVLTDELVHWRASARTPPHSAYERQSLERRGKELVEHLARVRSIRRRVYELLHAFATITYHRLLFSGLAGSIFDDFKERTDRQLVEIGGDILVKFPAAYRRIAEGDNESISQALTTCRRIIEAFADSIYPPVDGAVELGGNQLKTGGSHYQNRINLYIARNVTSDSRRKRLRQGLSNLYERVSAGVHSDVSPSEARALILETYVFLGEVLESATEQSSTEP